jgi:hypothetical protein
VSARITNRTLSSLRRYDPLDHDTFEKRLPEFPARLPREVFVGVYYNTLESLENCLLVTSRGIRVNGPGGWSLLLYDDTERVVTPAQEDMEISDHVSVVTRDGRGTDLPVVGGRGRLRDAWVIIRLLQRSLDPVRNHPE